MNACLLGGVFLAVGHAPAFDLTTIDRSIRKEPVYTTRSPEYCLFVFGPQARTRVWVVRDGDAVYVDRNGNGDLTEPGERVARDGSTFRIGQITEVDGKTVHHNWSLTQHSDGYGSHINAARRGRQLVAPQEHPKPRFAPRPEDAPIIHFDGPLALSQYAETRALPRGAEGRIEDEDTALRILIGTPGLGRGTFAACPWACASGRGPILAEFDYPARPPSKRLRVTAALPTFS